MATTSLKTGQKAPSFNTTDEQGNPVSSKSLLGHNYALVFYPKDNTPTCTTELCNLRDNYDTLTKAGYKIFGISPDSQKKHQNFIKKFDFPFPLLLDTELEMLNKYKVWGPKKVFGKETIGVYRTTFLIDKDGKISKIIDKVKAKDHANQILEN